MTRLSPLLLLVLAAACSKDNPNYCEGALDNNCANVDAGGSGDGGPQACATSQQCADVNDALPVCGPAGECVQCTEIESAACTNTTPVCGANNTCTACTEHSQCTESNLCLPTGDCAASSDVAYVSPGATGTACTKAEPCPTLIEALNRGQPYIKIASGTVRDDATTVIDDETVIIAADPGAVLDRDGDGPILQIQNNSFVQIFDLQISGATGLSNGDGVVVANGATVLLSRVTVTENQNRGVSMTGGSLTVTRSTVSLNQGGGISITNTTGFSITNNFIYRNGNQDTATFGGVNIGVATVSGTSELAFNTIVDNRAATGATRAGGIVCDATFAAPNNIIARNTVGGTATLGNSQTVGVCTYPTPRIQNDLAGLLLASPDTAPYNYRLTIGSSAIDQATTPSTVVVDFDGEVRGAAKDIGADEYQ